MVVNGSNPGAYRSQPQTINAVQPQPPVSNPQRRQQYIFVPPMTTSSQQRQAGNTPVWSVAVWRGSPSLSYGSPSRGRCNQYVKSTAMGKYRNVHDANKKATWSASCNPREPDLEKGERQQSKAFSTLWWCRHVLISNFLRTLVHT
jgi:hypothetical protein